MKDETYYFHQTPETLCFELIKQLPICPNDTAIDPFKGEGSFFRALKSKTDLVDWCEIQDGRDYREMGDEYDWIVTNPPFRLEEGGKRENSFWRLILEFSTKFNKGLAFLGNDYCLSTLTPKRIKLLNEKGVYLSKIITCSIKKWRGRYFFLVFTKEKNDLLTYVDGNH